jgi:hypothetical protein
MTVSGDEGHWGRAKTRQRSILRSALIGLPIGAVGAIVSFLTELAHAIAFEQYWFNPERLGLVAALFAAFWVAILLRRLGKMAPSAGNEPNGSGRYLLRAQCRSEDKLRIRSLLISNGAILTDDQGADRSNNR